MFLGEDSDGQLSAVSTPIEASNGLSNLFQRFFRDLIHLSKLPVHAFAPLQIQNLQRLVSVRKFLDEISGFL